MWEQLASSISGLGPSTYTRMRDGMALALSLASRVRKLGNTRTFRLSSFFVFSRDGSRTGHCFPLHLVEVIVLTAFFFIRRF